MVEGFAHITIKGVTETISLTPLEMAAIVADRKGFQVVDAEPMGQSWRIKAYANGKVSSSVTANGSSLTAAVSRLIESIW